MRHLFRACVLLLAGSGCHPGPSTRAQPIPDMAPDKRVVVVDLAALAPGGYSTPRGQPQIDTVRVIDLVPFKYYDISFDQAARAQATLPAPPGAQGAKAEFKSPGQGIVRIVFADSAPKCARTLKAFDDLQKRATEYEISKQIALILDAAQAEVANGACSVGQVDTVVAEVARLTTRSFGIGKVAPTQDLVVTTTRPGDTSGTTLTWKRTYAGRDDGDWRVLYGFLFAPDVWPAYTFYSEATTDGKFQIQRRRVRSAVSLIPSVQYVFHDALPGTDWCGCKPTAGLGFDLTTPSVHGGFIWSFHENISLSLGAVTHQVRELSDRYVVNQVIATNLDNTQLTQAAFHLDPYIAISFRFGSSPFSTPGTTSSGAK